MRKEKIQSPLQENKMGVMPIGKLLLNMAAPMVLSMLVQALYNVVDSIYVSRISENAVTSLGLAFPIQNIQIGMATGIGVGVNSLLSKSLGQGNQERADHTAGNGFFLMLISTVLLMLFGIFGARHYYEIQSEVTEIVDGGTIYTTICCVGTLGIFMEILNERILQATGRTMYTMVTQSTGAIVNILLDPLFIFGGMGIPAMGIAGAAMATIIGQWVAALMALTFNLKFNADVHFSIKNLKPRGDILGPVLNVGIPSVIMMAVGSVMTFSMNQILLSFQGIGETAAGVFGVYFKLQSFFFMPLFGLNNATISIVAFNFGARKPERITKTLKIACTTAFCVMMVGFAAFQLLPDLLLNFFEPSDAFRQLGRSALRTISFHFPMAAFGVALGASFQALGNGIYTTITSLCRQLIVLLPAAYLLSLSGDVNAVWWSFPIAEMASLIVTLLLFVHIYRKKVKPLYQM